MSEENTANEEKYFQSKKTRPAKNLSGGHGKYCCIPGCKSATADSKGNKTNISLFKIRQDWVATISKFRRKGGKDNFDINHKNVRICEFHFDSQDIKVSLGIGRKTVKSGAIPTIFEHVKPKEKPKRKSPRKRPPPIDYSSESIIETDDDNSAETQEEEDLSMNWEDDFSYENSITPDPEPELTEVEILKLKVEELKLENVALRENQQLLHNENENLKKEIELLQDQKYSYKNISKDEKLFIKATGISVESFKALLELLNPGEKSSNIKFYDTSRRMSNEKHSQEDISYLKRGGAPLLDNEEQFFLYLSWLRNGFTLSHLGWLFKLSKTTVSRYIITWSNFCYFTLGSLPIWPTREQVNKTMPESFKRVYPTTRCIIDCTELFCQRPSSLAIQSALYSSYKSHVTYKGLVGIDPSGAITFVSELFDGSISDQQIVRRSGFLQNQWDSGKDSVMADRGFTVADDLSPLGVSLNIPCFLEGRDQLTAAEVKESQTIASVRIHVERAIQRIKKFRILRNEIPLTLHGSINQIWTVCCLLTNSMPPLIQKDTEE
ncbi:uncharacterized protein [Clytia hemisphaerica]|uniref:uncharacterized protein n=1 Tax=Clytia hemisphaerica TaxID=252671 RepID=UPI0034D5C444